MPHAQVSSLLESSQEAHISTKRTESGEYVLLDTWDTEIEKLSGLWAVGHFSALRDLSMRTSPKKSQLVFSLVGLVTALASTRRLRDLLSAKLPPASPSPFSSLYIWSPPPVIQPPLIYGLLPSCSEIAKVSAARAVLGLNNVPGVSPGPWSGLLSPPPSTTSHAPLGEAPKVLEVPSHGGWAILPYRPAFARRLFCQSPATTVLGPRCRRSATIAQAKSRSAASRVPVPLHAQPLSKSSPERSTIQCDMVTPGGTPSNRLRSPRVVSALRERITRLAKIEAKLEDMTLKMAVLAGISQGVVQTTLKRSGFLSRSGAWRR